MKILIAGSSGLIGTALCAALGAANCTIYKLKRITSTDDSHTILWNPEKGELDLKKIEGFDVAINLAGENIFGRWTTNKKAAILESRLSATTLLANALASLDRPPEVLLNASAIGYYGSKKGDTELTENSPPGDDFLAEVCQRWEAATTPAEERGVRCVLLRTGVVLSPAGGALKSMLFPFKLGLGGRLGDGTQYMSWISIDDLMGAICFLIQHRECSGAFNLTAPGAVTNSFFTSALGSTLHRPTFFTQPAFLIKCIFGEMGESVLLGSTRAYPEKLLESGYSFLYPKLQEALQHLL